MALGTDYATLAELKAYANATKDTYDDLLTDALSAASRGIETICHRQFNDAGSATARVYRPLHSTLVEVDDFHTLIGLVVKTSTAGDNVFDTTWTAAEYEPRPLNGIIGGQPGWPYNQLWGDGTRLFPAAKRASVEVTARWGWAAVPLPVKQACLMVATEIYKSKDAPFGVAGNGTFGEIRVRENPLVMRKLSPYVIDPILAVA